MTSTTTILNNDGKTSLSRPPDLEGTEEIRPCVFTDLCRGPQMPSTSDIKSVKLMKMAGAYWRGNEKNKCCC